MQSTWENGQEPRGFAGLAALGIPVEDMLTDVAAPAPSRDAANPLHFINAAADRAARNRVRGPGGAWLGWAAMAVVAGLLAVAMFIWRVDNSTPELVDIDADDPARAVQPSIGSGQLLSRAQIRYCLAEEMRLQAARDVVGSKAVDVTRLNASVADLNARCSAFQYQGDDLALAEADVLARADTIHADGELAFLLPDEQPTQSISAAAADAAASDTANSDELVTSVSGADVSSAVATNSAEPSKLVRDVQWLLFKLNFYDGDMSGLDSAATQAARARFLEVGGHPSSSDMAATLVLLNDTVKRSDAAVAEDGDGNATAALTGSASSALDTAPTPALTPAPEPPAAAVLPASVSQALVRLADADRLAIEQLCRSGARGDYADCVNGQLIALQSAPNVALTPLSDEERRVVLSNCGPLRASVGPAAFYLCKAEQAGLAVKLSDQNAPVAGDLPQSVVDVIQSRCVPFQTAAVGEHARCVSGQFANLSEALNPVFIAEVDFTERASIESVCATTSPVADVVAFYNCVSDELTALDQVGGKPDMRVATFAHRKDIEAACQQDRLSRGPSDYYRCLQSELTARGY